MTNKIRTIQKRLIRCAGKRRLSNLTQQDIDRLWSERVNRAEERTEDYEELHELFKWISKSLRTCITSASNVGTWADVTLEMIVKYPRKGLSECQNEALDELIKRKRNRRVKRTVPSCRTDVPVEPIHKLVSDKTASQTESKVSSVCIAYYGSNSTKTRQLYRRLKDKGLDGEIAVELLRVHKSSSRAKQYRGDYKGYAYARKGELLKRLCDLLSRSTYRWGWGEDTKEEYAPHVVYVDLPEGQVSFHSVDCGEGPEYPSSWDGQHASEARIIRFA